MKLYEVPRNTLVRSVEIGLVFTFNHIDGMYSYCTDGKDVYHFTASLEVEIVENPNETKTL